MCFPPSLFLIVISVGLMACTQTPARKLDLNGGLRQVRSLVARGSDKTSESPTESEDDDDDDDESARTSGADPVTRIAGQAAARVLPGHAMTFVSRIVRSARDHLAAELGAAGLAAAGGGLVFGARARSSLRDAKELCGESLTCNNSLDYDKGMQLIGEARSSATISTVLVAAGGVAIVASAIMIVTAPSTRQRSTMAIAPTVHDRGAGIAVIGGF